MDQDGPVAVIIRHWVKPGKAAEVEEWLPGITRAAGAFEDYLGYNVVRPADAAHPEYVVFFRLDTFATRESLARHHPLGTAAAPGGGLNTEMRLIPPACLLVRIGHLHRRLGRELRPGAGRALCGVGQVVQVELH